MAAFRRYGNPPLSAFKIDEENDDIILALKRNRLLNNKEDKVKIIFYPSYLSVTDRMLSLTYHQTIQGKHLGIFPSYYEPWGYTPLDTAANGVLAITSNLAGFGAFIKSYTDVYTDEKRKTGIMVLE